jgi:hypothetical protein
MVMSPVGLGPKNNCDVEEQKEFISHSVNLFLTTGFRCIKLLPRKSGSYGQLFFYL